MVLLRTERLREFVENDWPPLYAVESRPDVARYQSFAPRTEQESRAYVLGAVEAAKEHPRTTYDLALVLPPADRPLGRFGLGLPDASRIDAAIWYTLHPDAWGHGYATEATRALVDFGCRDLRLHRIWVACDPANVASRRLLERIGMRREDHLRQNARVKDAWVDSPIYAILDHEWQRRPAPYSREFGQRRP